MKDSERPKKRKTAEELGSDDPRGHKQNGRLSQAWGYGIFVSDFEQGEIGPDLFRKACEFGLEGLVSKHRDRPYRGGRQKHWIKVKNRKHHAFDRMRESFS